MSIYTTQNLPPPTGSPPPNSQPPQSGGSSSSWSYGSRDPYDARIGNGSLPQGIWGSQNRAYVRNTQGNELVSNQLNGLIDANNPYIQSARRHAVEQANGRGLLNSSISAGAAQRAAIDAALPIAQGDATAYQNTAEQNQRWLNQQQMAMEGNAAQLDAASASAASQLEAARYGDDTRLQMQRENLAYGGEQQGLDRAFQDYMSTRGFQNQMGLMNQGYWNNMGQNAFDRSTQMMLNNQTGAWNAINNNWNNPAFSPETLNGVSNYMDSYYGPYMDSLLNSVFGGAYGY